MFCQFPLCQKPSTVDNPEQLPVKTENRAPLNIWLIYLTCVLFCRRILILVTIYAVCAPHAFYFLFYKVLSTKWQTVAPPCIDWNFFFFPLFFFKLSQPVTQIHGTKVQESVSNVLNALLSLVLCNIKNYLGNKNTQIEQWNNIFYAYMSSVSTATKNKPTKSTSSLLRASFSQRRG